MLAAQYTAQARRIGHILARQRAIDNTHSGLEERKEAIKIQNDQTIRKLQRATVREDEEADQIIDETVEAYEGNKAAMTCKLKKAEEWFEKRVQLIEGRAKEARNKNADRGYGGRQ